MLLQWNGFRSSRYSRAFFENIAFILHTPNFQFCPQLPPAVWSCTLSKTSVTQVSYASCFFHPVMNCSLRLEPSTMLLKPSETEFPHPPSKLTNFALRILSALRLTRLTAHEKTNIIMASTNLTILNFLLFNLQDLGIRLGEEGLVCVMIGLQVSIPEIFRSNF